MILAGTILGWVHHRFRPAGCPSEAGCRPLLVRGYWPYPEGEVEPPE